MGFDWVDKFDSDTDGGNKTSNEQSSSIQQVINLMDDDDDELEVLNTSTDATSELDSWTQNARRIQADLIHMAKWIQSKKQEYVGLDMPSDEASLIQSTVTSFAATTAAEIETLRKLIPNSHDDVATHRSGVVQILLSQVQEDIADTFGALQKQRTRVSVHIWQNPLQCKLYIPKPQKSSDESALVDLFDEATTSTSREQRFLPRQPLQLTEENDIFDEYTLLQQNNDSLPHRPDFLQRLDSAEKNRDGAFGSVPESPTKDFDTPQAEPHRPILPKLMSTPNKAMYMSEEEKTEHFQAELQQEAALLTVSMVQNDLDSVQKMEQRMVQITTLISQFSNLVSEQQEEIWDIAQSAEKSKENMEKGQENLVDAAERTKRSKHYMAWTIFGVSLVLLFFHAIKN